MKMTSLMEGFTETSFRSSLDESEEKYLFWKPRNDAPKALVVGLHTWSADRYNQQARFFPYCEARGWALILPEFRGPNLTTNPRASEAGASAKARRDIIDASRHFMQLHELAKVPRFLLGGSGGGHMALMTAARENFDWTAVSSWCPITDLRAWHAESPGYAKHVAAVCGGDPGTSEAVDREYTERSPLPFVANLEKVRLFLAHGRGDKVVPVEQSLRLIQALEAQKPRQFFHWIFDGGHTLIEEHAFRFFDQSMPEPQSANVELTG